LARKKNGLFPGEGKKVLKTELERAGGGEGKKKKSKVCTAKPYLPLIPFPKGKHEERGTEADFKKTCWERQLFNPVTEGKGTYTHGKITFPKKRRVQRIHEPKNDTYALYISFNIRKKKGGGGHRERITTGKGREKGGYQSTTPGGRVQPSPSLKPGL